eukprot:118511-Prymnesium_polylepis.1
MAARSRSPSAPPLREASCAQRRGQNGREPREYLLWACRAACRAQGEALSVWRRWRRVSGNRAC